MTDILSQLNQIERHIREGRLQEAQRVLDETLKRRVPKKYKWRLADFLLRLGNPEAGVRQLHRYIRPERSSKIAASPREIATYAHCLLKLGAGAEALELLSSLPVSRVPEVLIYQATAYVMAWDYRTALPLIRKYLGQPGVNVYRKRVAQLNFVACLISVGELGRARTLLNQIMAETQVKQNHLLYSNALELATQLHIKQKNWNLAEQCIEKAQEIIGGQGTANDLFVRKWSAILDFRRTGNRASLQEAMALAKQMQHWETFRDCARFDALEPIKEQDLLTVYLGTPYPAFRAQIIEEVGTLKIPNELTLGSGKDLLDLLQGQWQEKEIPQSVHRTLLALAKDLFAPQRIGMLHSALYPEECFHPISSPKRVYESVRRARRWIEKEKAPVILEEIGGRYRLQFECRVRVPGEDSAFDITLPLFARLKTAPLQSEFTARGACEALGMNIRSFQRELDVLVSQGKVERLGSGRSTRYRLAA